MEETRLEPEGKEEKKTNQRANGILSNVGKKTLHYLLKGYVNALELMEIFTFCLFVLFL